MKKVLAICFDNVEEGELLLPVDMLRRSNITVDICTIGKTKVTSSHDVTFEVKDLNTIKDIESYDMLFVPGGAHFKELYVNTRVHELIRYFLANRSVSAICAGPTVLGKLGLLKGRNYTCFTRMNEDFGGNYTDCGVTVDKNLITGKSVSYSLELGLHMVEYLTDKETLEILKGQIYYK